MAYGWRRNGNITRNLSWYTVKVKKGQTLDSIAKSVKPAQSVSYLKKWNGLSSDKISAGQTIKVYPRYKVAWGDTMGDISKSFGTTHQKLWKVNPQIENINKVYPGDIIRLLDGMEPEEKSPVVPAAKPKAAPKAAPKKADTPPGTKQTRNTKSNDYWDDDLPAHRKTAGDYFLRIGDCQFVVPPEFIQVHRGSDIISGNMMRQKESWKYKPGHSQSTITIQLWFTNLEEINGFEVVSPISEQKYYMDGLRPLIAQFKRMPFLPVINEYLNDVMDIHAVALSNLSFTTVEGFPDMIQANLSLIKMEVDMYIGKPTWTFDQHFMYPLFRWHYNQMLQSKKPYYSSTYLQTVEKANFTNKVEFSILNEGFLRETKADNKLKSIELDKIGYDKVDIPSTLICTGIFGSLGNTFAPIHMDMRENTTFQYLGGSETQFMLSFETMDRDAVACLERLYSTTERYSRQYKDKIVTGYIRVKNSLLNMAGVYNIMVTEMVVGTVPAMPDVFKIQLSVVSFKDSQRLDQRLNGYNTMDAADASKIAKGTVGDAEKYLAKKNEPWFITEEGIAEGMLDTLELYPDLELPTYSILNDVLKKVQAHRKKQGHTKMPIDKFDTPRHLFREYGKQSFETKHLTDDTFVDPDFYFTYPEWNEIQMIDTSLIENDALDIKLGVQTAQKAKKGEVKYGNSSPGGLPTSGAYTGPAKGPHNNANLKSGLAGTDKWNNDLVTGAKRNGINALFLKCIMAIESAGNLNPKKPSTGATGPFQILPSSYPKFDFNRMARDIQYAIDCASAVYKDKAKISRKSDVWTVARYYYHATSQAGKTYADQVALMYEGLGGSRRDDVFGEASVGGGVMPPLTAANAEILKNAEADVVLTIPKDAKEESKVSGENENNDAAMKAMLHDMTKYSQRGSMNRAFPTFVLCFVDEGMWVDYRRLWNNYYTYHAVEELMVVKERNQPTHTAYIRLQNIYGALNQSNKPDFKANNATAFPGWSKGIKAVGSNIKWWWNTWFPVMTDEMVQQRMKHIEKSGFYLRAGARVHIRMGYGSVASMMPIAFNGRVTEISNEQGGDLVQAICQSDGLELVEPYYEWANDSRTTWWNLRQEPKNIIDNLLVARKGLDWLANYDNPFTHAGGTESKYGIEHFGYVIGKDHAWYNFFGDFFGGLFGAETVNGYDARKNVYVANGRGVFGKDEGGKDESNIHFWQTGKSPWDVIALMAAVTPDYEAKVHEHGFHSTLFFGEPHWLMKHGYYNTGKDPGDRKNYKEVLKPSQQFHHIDSMSDIVSNLAKVSGRHITTVVVPLYSFDEKPKAADTIFADPNLKPEMQKTEIIDTTLLQDFPMSDWLAEAARWVGNAVEEGVKSIIGLWNDSLDNKDFISQYSRTERLALEAGKSHIQMKFREMYQGEIIIIGDGAIHPGDICSLADTHEQMFGIHEVGRVVHIMGFDHGFTTSLKPDLVAVRKDGKRAEMLAQWSNVATYFALTTMRRIMKRYFFKKPSKITTALTKGLGLIKSIRSIRNTAAAGTAGVSAISGPPGWIAGAIAELALWTVSELIIQSIEKALNPQRAGIIIQPLWWKNRPYVAGIDGHKELIPGYWDENVYGEITPGANPGGGGGAGGGTYKNNLKSMSVPEGYSVCTPTLNQRVTDTYWHWRDKKDGWAKSYYHKGVDYGAITAGVNGDPIMAVANGEVYLAGVVNGYGNTVIIKHDFKPSVKWPDAYIFGIDGEVGQGYTLYGHLDKILCSKGQKVNVGDIIGQMGHTGGNFATHLHFEFRTANVGFGQGLPGFFDIEQKKDKYDPQKFLKNAKAYKFPKSAWPKK